MVNASHLCAENAPCLEAFEVDHAQESEEPFKVWMEAMEKMAVNRKKEDQEYQELLRLLDSLYSGYKKGSKKSTIRMYIRDMQETLSDYVQSAGISHFIEELDRMMRPRGYCGGTSQKERQKKGGV